MSATLNRQILRIALPSIATNLTVPLLALCDTALAGHLGGGAPLAALALGGMLFSMVYWVLGFLRMGTGGMTAQAAGRGDDRAATLILLRAGAVALVCAAAILALHRPLLLAAITWLEAGNEVEALAAAYFRIVVWGAPAVLGQYVLTGWLLGVQNARYPMVAALIQNGVNVVVSAVLAFPLGLKMTGIALGTLTAQYVGAVLCAALLWRKYRALLCSVRVYTWTSLCNELVAREPLRRFFTVNRDIFLRTLCLVAVTMAFTAAGAAQGDAVLAANALLMQFFTLFSYLADGFAYAGESLGGYYCGRGDGVQLLRLARRLFRLGGALALVCTLLYIIGGDALLAVLTSDPAARGTAGQYLAYAAAVPAVGIAAFLFDGLFIGLTATRPMLVAMLAASAAFFALRFALVPRVGNEGLWAAFLLYLALRGGVQAVLFRRVVRKSVPLP